MDMNYVNVQVNDGSKSHVIGGTVKSDFFVPFFSPDSYGTSGKVINKVINKMSVYNKLVYH